MGIEPTKRHANDASAALKAVGPQTEGIENQSLTDFPPTGGTKSDTIDPLLGSIIEAWPQLSAEARRAVVATVKALTNGR